MRDMNNKNGFTPHQSGEGLTRGAGFTIMELIIVMLIVAVIAFISVPILLTAADAFSFLLSRNQIDQTADVAMGRMSREIRRLRNQYCLYTADATTLKFKQIDTEDNTNTITYSLSGTDLKRKVESDSGAEVSDDILASGIDSLTFTYYNVIDTIITTPDIYPKATDVRRVDIFLTLKEGDEILYYKSQIKPWNLMHLSYLFY